MKTIEVSFLPLPGAEASMKDISALLDAQAPHRIENGWFDQFPYQPKASFRMAYGDYGLYLKFEVEEETRVARFRTANDPVYKDSCVEAFLALDDDSYYNLEFNSLGTALVEYGRSKVHKQYRIAVDASLIRKIKTFSVIGREGKDGVAWQLTLLIPLDIFCHHPGATLRGKSLRANLQKCGDDLPKPHFLSWNKIETPEPDFHQPHFFGEVKFQ